MVQLGTRSFTGLLRVQNKMDTIDFLFIKTLVSEIEAEFLDLVMESSNLYIKKLP